MELKDTNLLETWPQYLTGTALVFGIIISILSQNILITLVTAVVIGFFSANLIYGMFQIQPIGPYYFIIIALCVGFIAGSFFANRFLMFLVLLGSFIIFYYLHDKGYIKAFKSKQFLK